ncbi:hypothetical protein D021_0617B, partial [Vibrio parahaemolyticus 10296]
HRGQEHRTCNRVTLEDTLHQKCADSVLSAFFWVGIISTRNRAK